jgi:hypothetical protein
MLLLFVQVEQQSYTSMEQTQALGLTQIIIQALIQHGLVLKIKGLLKTNFLETFQMFVLSKALLFTQAISHQAQHH